MEIRLVMSLVLLLSACAPQGPAPAEILPAQSPVLVEAKISTDLPEASRALLRKDFTRLERSPIQEKDSEATKVFEAPALSSGELVEWLNQRVRSIVSENFISLVEVQNGIFPASLTTLKVGQTYEHPSVLPLALAQNSEALSGSITLAENLGVSLYVVGKFTGSLLGVLLPGSEHQVPVASPRVGILAMGRSLFGDWLDENIRFQDNSLSDGVDSFLGSEYRLGVLFHEARHSDGHGKSLGFLHVPCPVGHDYAGQAACDASLNGAYATQGQYLKLIARDCRECSVKESEVLRVFALDFFVRILPSLRKRVSEAETLRRCQDLLALNQPLPPSCYYDEEPTGYWDTNPESAVP